jgi:hypothetical protein
MKMRSSTPPRVAVNKLALKAGSVLQSAAWLKVNAVNAGKYLSGVTAQKDEVQQFICPKKPPAR